VVPVVPSFSDGTPRDEWILGGVGENIVRVISVEMSGRVNAPGEVKDNDVSEGSAHEKGGPEVFAPVARGNLCGQDKAHVKGCPWVALLLPVHEGIGQQIGEVHLATGLNDSGVLFDNEPTDVGVEKSSGGVVRIRGGFRKFVVDSVVASPMVDSSLVRNRVAQHKNRSEDKVGLVRSVRP